MNKTVLSLAALIGLSATGGALAQGLDFNSLDANADGAISMEELQVAIPDLTPESFAMLDTDADGALSSEEFAALIPATEAPANTMEAPAVDGAVEAPLAQ
ncbi:EF-hand domain-containing protein [Pelagibacterium halotolerans]|nr:EF-hand domain-containing protein [Pelagibacterium halotolerans]QJR18382.1 EF-hand domain-containing protein [Pelagibacterium halotolerans]SEA24016.1 EF hand [Pelagibacterium halotolerans]